MLAGRPHETVGNDGPRWMTAVRALSADTEPGLQAGSPLHTSLNRDDMFTGPPGSVLGPAEIL
jgi:hypothetical protein